MRVSLFSGIVKKSSLNRQLCLSLRFSTCVIPDKSLQSSQAEIELKAYTDVGITEFLGSGPKISATIKDRPTDFQVHELGTDKKKTRLTTVVPPPNHVLDMQCLSRVNRYVHCSLYKEGIEQTDAINFVSDRLGIEPNSITMKGRKDKLAQTTQRICFPANNRTAKQYAKQTANWDTVLIGNYSYSSRPLRFGVSYGNHFTILMRNVTMASNPENSTIDSAVDEAFNNLCAKGFINYWGLQKFGFNCHKAGAEMLKMNWTGAFDLILAQKETDYPHIAAGKEAWLLKRDPMTASSFFQEYSNKTRQETLDKLSEILYQLTLDNGKGDYLKVYLSLKNSTKSLFIPAYISFLWNKLITARIQKFGTKVLPGDFVGIPRRSSESELESADTSPPEEDKSSALLTVDGYSTSGQKYHRLTETDLQDGHSYSIDQVYLPVLGTKLNRYPNDELQEMFEKILAEDGLRPDFVYNTERSLKDTLPMGFFRQMITIPKDLCYKIVEYNDQDDLNSLMPSDVELMLKKSQLRESGIGKRLVKDGMKTPEFLPENGQVKDKTAIIVEFTLPASAYATVALREVMMTTYFTPY